MLSTLLKKDERGKKTNKGKRETQKLNSNVNNAKAGPLVANMRSTRCLTLLTTPHPNHEERRDTEAPPPFVLLLPFSPWSDTSLVSVCCA